jgi:hypothetical protein
MLYPEQLEEAARTDATVQRLLEAGAKPYDIVNALVREKKAMLKRILELDSIAPRRIATPDGKIFIYRCPDEFVPIMEIKE